MNLAVSTNLKTVFPTISDILDTASNKRQLTEMTKVKLYSKMDRFTRVNYRMIRKKAMGYKCGQTGRDMRASGTRIKLQDKASSCIQTVMFLMGNGKKIKQMDVAHTSIKMVLFLPVYGSMISSMGKAKKVIPMDQLMKECTIWERKQGKASIDGSMAVAIKAPGLKTRLKVLEHIIGLTVDVIQANGKTT